MHDISAGMREIISKVFSPDALPILIKASENYDQLTDEEAMRLVALCGQYFLAWEEAFIQHQAGRLADRNWNSLSRYFRNGMGLSGIQKAWLLRKDFFDEEFVQYVDSESTIEYKAR